MHRLGTASWKRRWSQLDGERIANVCVKNSKEEKAPQAQQVCAETVGVFSKLEVVWDEQR